uniref:Uncharacterized protein n=1 Tax=Globodera pallida TaxID=36090 RepID=A0A183CJX0_GLOPA
MDARTAGGSNGSTPPSQRSAKNRATGVNGSVASARARITLEPENVFIAFSFYVKCNDSTRRGLSVRLFD